MSFKSIRQVATYKPLSRCNMEELAAHHGNVRPSGGTLFARSKEHDQKDIARDLILNLFVPAAWPGHLSILTMPGMDWRFERMLLGHREPGWTHKRERPERTRINSVENDRAIYYSAVSSMPGLNTLNALTQIRKPPPFAETTVKTKFIKRFWFGNVDDLMAQEGFGQWDAAWLDYTGPMSIKRMKLIEAFYQRCVRKVLIVTVLKARWNKETSVAISKAGGHSEWLHRHLPGDVLHDIEYFDTSPMTQFAVRRTAEVVT